MMMHDDSRRAHEAIRAAAYALHACVRAGPPLTDLGRLRMTLATVVREHLPVQQALVKKAQPHFAGRKPAYDRILDEDRELRLRYSDHIRRWVGDAIASDFPAYAADVETLIDRLDRYLRLLEDDLFEPMLEANIKA